MAGVAGRLRARRSLREKGRRTGAGKRVFRVLVSLFFAVYTLVTLFPFYVLFVRTFVGTKDAATLHLWLPPETPITMEAGIGNLSVFYNLDIGQFKQDFGIVGYIPSQMTLGEIAEKYDIPPERIQRYFLPYGRYTGWISLFSGDMGRMVLSCTIRTLVFAVASVVGVNLLGLLTGYGLAGLRRRFHMAVYNLYLLEMVIPGIMILLPQFMIVQRLIGLVPGTGEAGLTRYAVQLIALILLNVRGGALSTMMFTSSIGAIPRELEEAAEIDGATRLQYLWRVVLPLMKVPMASLAVIYLPGLWNQFMLPYVYLDPSNSLLIPLIQTFAGKYTTNYQVVYTAMLVSILPLVVVYIVFRRLFVQGAMAGAIKG